MADCVFRNRKIELQFVSNRDVQKEAAPPTVEIRRTKAKRRCRQRRSLGVRNVLQGVDNLHDVRALHGAFLDANRISALSKSKTRTIILQLNLIRSRWRQPPLLFIATDESVSTLRMLVKVQLCAVTELSGSGGARKIIDLNTRATALKPRRLDHGNDVAHRARLHARRRAREHRRLLQSRVQSAGVRGVDTVDGNCGARHFVDNVLQHHRRNDVRISVLKTNIAPVVCATTWNARRSLTKARLPSFAPPSCRCIDWLKVLKRSSGTAAFVETSAPRASSDLRCMVRPARPRKRSRVRRERPFDRSTVWPRDATHTQLVLRRCGTKAMGRRRRGRKRSRFTTTQMRRRAVQIGRARRSASACRLVASRRCLRPLQDDRGASHVAHRLARPCRAHERVDNCSHGTGPCCCTLCLPRTYGTRFRRAHRRRIDNNWELVL